MAKNCYEIYNNRCDTNIQFRTGKKAVAEIKTCLQERIDFHQETTLGGQTVLHTAKEAKSMGYTVHLWYIFVADVEVAKRRVRTRVANGGHGIPDEIIERRNITSLKTLKSIIPLCDEVWLYDNTVTYNPVVHITDGTVTLLDKNIPLHILSCFE